MLFTVSYFCRDKADLTEVEELCNFLSQNEILDGPATESLILGFSITDSWKKAVKLLEEFETSIGSVCYNAVLITKLFLYYAEINLVLYLNAGS